MNLLLSKKNSENVMNFFCIIDLLFFFHVPKIDFENSMPNIFQTM
jgi:hypothetical protein